MSQAGNAPRSPDHSPLSQEWSPGSSLLHHQDWPLNHNPGIVKYPKFPPFRDLTHNPYSFAVQYTEGKNLTLFLRKAQDGVAEQNDSRWPLIYRKLHMIADRMMLSERNDHTLSVNGLIHETYLRLFASSASWQNREHFYRSFSRTMKRTLIDYARNRNSLKREGRKNKLPIGDAVQVASEPAMPAMELKLAVEQLAAFDARLAQVIEMRFFKQMSIQEIAKQMAVSTRTIDRDLNRAKLLLFRSLIAEHIPAPSAEKTCNS